MILLGAIYPAYWPAVMTLSQKFLVAPGSSARGRRVQITIDTPDQCYYQARPGTRVCWRIDALIRESQGAPSCTATPSGGSTAGDQGRSLGRCGSSV